MEGEPIHHLIGTATKYISLVGGITSSITVDSPQNYFFAGIFGFLYLGGEIMQKTSKDKELKNLEEKLKK